MKIRKYTNSDYEALIELFQSQNEFSVDIVTDSRERILAKVNRDSAPMLVAEDGGALVGSVSIIEDGRIAWLFRAVAKSESIFQDISREVESTLKERGYDEGHWFGPDTDEAIKRRTALGFTKGSVYRWF
jgi:hypothetical protein